MATPKVPPPPVDPAALQRLGEMISGKPTLSSNPGLIQSLMQGGAMPADAGAVDRLMSGLQTQRRVNLARASGQKIILSGVEKQQMFLLGDNPDNALMPQQDMLKQAQTANPNYNITSVDEQGNVTAATPKNQPASDTGGSSKSGGWFDSPGSFIGHLAHDVMHNPLHDNALSPANGSGAAIAGAIPAGVKNVAGDALSGITQAWNSVEGNLTYHDPLNPTYSPSQQAAALVDQHTNDNNMTAMGYDPNNQWSRQAYTSRGHLVQNTADLVQHWDESQQSPTGYGTAADAVAGAYARALDPKKYFDDTQADQTLTPEQKAARIGGDTQFDDLTRRAVASHASFGNDTMHALGVDPVKNPREFSWASAGIDLAASFALDPTLMAGRAYAGYKVAARSVQAADGMYDADLFTKALTSNNPMYNGVQRSAQFAMDETHAMAAAEAAGDADGMAYHAARLRAGGQGWAQLAPDISGVSQKLDNVGTVGPGEPITTLKQLADYMTSKHAYTRLTTGKAVVESGMMPGSMSALGFQKWKALQAGLNSTKAAARNDALQATIRNTATIADTAAPAEAARLLPSEVDAVDAVTGEPIARTGDEFTPLERLGIAHAQLKAREAGVSDASVAPASTGDVPSITTMPSQTRAQAQRAADGAYGDALRDSRYGTGQTLLDLSKINPKLNPIRVDSLTPSTLAARGRLVQQRLSSFLPRHGSAVDFNAPDYAETAYRYAREFLTPYDANLAYAKSALGDIGDRKALLNSLNEQTAHAAGVYRTPAGRDFMKQFVTGEKETYGHNGTSLVGNPDTQELHDIALHSTHLTEMGHIYGFQDLYKYSTMAAGAEAMIGKAMSSAVVDGAADTAKLSMLLAPKTVARNVIEPSLQMFIRGGGMNREVTGMRGLIKDIGKETGTGTAHPRTKAYEAALKLSGLEFVGKAYRQALGKTLDLSNSYSAEWLRRAPEDFDATINGIGRAMPGSHRMSDVVADTDGMFKDGFLPTRVTRVGFDKKAPTDGGRGAFNYANSLGKQFNTNPLTPLLFKAVKAGDGDVTDIINYLKSPEYQSTLRKFQYHDVYLDPSDGLWKRAVTDKEWAQVYERHARNMLEDARYLTSNPVGDSNAVLDHVLETGKLPDQEWIQSNVPNEARPDSVQAPRYEAKMPGTGGVAAFARSILDGTGRAYQRLVEDPLKRTMSEPVYMVNYEKSRQLLAPAEKAAVDAGLSEDAAWQMMHDVARQRAYTMTEGVVDDPGLKTQFDVVGRNFFMFSRAVQAFVRRQGGLLLQNPMMFRKLFLATEAMHQAGMTYQDANGKTHFIYPGSDLLAGAMQKVEGLLPGSNMTQFPISNALTGELNMVSPGMDGPPRLSASPMLNLPLHAVYNMFPEHATVWDEIDGALNGQFAGTNPVKSFLPVIATKFYTAWDSDQRDSAMASAMVSAIGNLSAAAGPNGETSDGKPPADNGSNILFPNPDASKEQVDGWLQNLRVQVKNQLFVRAAFGLVAPAAPGMPTEAAKNASADLTFKLQGIHNLSDEYKKILDAVGGDRAAANVAFIGNDPARAIYTVPTTNVTSNKAYLPATATSAKWIENNLDFLGSHPKVGAYFIPQDPGVFDKTAYDAQMALGLREKKTPDEVYTAYRTSSAQNDYYAAKDQADADIAEAKKQGNTKLSTSLQNQWTAWSADFSAAHPLFRDMQASWADKRSTALDNLKDLGNVLKSDNLPANAAAVKGELQAMVDSYNRHEQYAADKTQPQLSKTRNSVSYQDHMYNLAMSNPILTSVYNGIFRALDSNLPLTYSPAQYTTVAKRAAANIASAGGSADAPADTTTDGTTTDGTTDGG